ncbi:serine hydrolase [Rufibacter psychrotolerans]|uniref:serine hydrolase n=1 Tax=Rufibacter psychrotolerans TaxID=2812556 RepID=UPI00196847B9|nr:serine hydrolase [Rufibacter sp. SYSU D00308]
MKTPLLCLAFALLGIGFASGQTKTDKFLAQLLQQHPEKFKTFLEHPEKYKIQILYTQIDRDKNNKPSFKTYLYQVNAANYFNPASTVKLPASLMALEKINTLQIPGLTKETVMLTDSAYQGQTKVLKDPTSANGFPSIAHYIKKILVTSDNDAYNRLYEFIGQEPLNEGLKAKGYRSVRLPIRLSRFLPIELDQYTNPVRFLQSEKVLYQQGLVKSNKDYKNPTPILMGKGNMTNDDKLVMEPRDFAFSNTFALEDQHLMLRAVLFPESVPAKNRFKLTPEDYRFLYQYMSQLPRETSYPAYDEKEYPDAFVKYLLFGGPTRKERIPEHIRIFNKIGQSFGFLTDNAYVVDFKNNVEFLLTATVHVNEDEIYNDGVYEYDTLGFPFLRDLGQVVYDHELKRKRKHQPDLTRFKLTYDKPALN